jgi:hypothetical protein
MAFLAGLHGFSGAFLVCLPVNSAKVRDQPMSSFLEDISRVMQKAYGKDIYPFEESFLLKTLDKRLSSTWINSLTAYSFYLSMPINVEIFHQTIREALDGK